MPDAPMRLECPACLGIPLETVAIAPDVPLRHCRRCGGTWILRGQSAALSSVLPDTLRALVRRAEDASFACHDCHGAMGRDAAACPACGWTNHLPCPQCGTDMRRETHRGVTVDVCRGCTGVWLDHHELSVIWTGAVARAGRRRGRAVEAVGDAGGLMLESLWYAPDVAFLAAHGAVHLGGAAMEAAAHAPGLAADAVANAPELASGAAEVVADAAGGVFSVIAEVIGGIFEAFG